MTRNTMLPISLGEVLREQLDELGMWLMFVVKHHSASTGVQKPAALR